MNNSSNGRARVYIADNLNGAACVRLIGEIDMSAVGTLDAAFAGIAAASRPAVYIDLADVEFADSTLVNFIYRLLDDEGPPIMLCRPRRLTHLLIDLCQLHHFTTITADLPADFSAEPAYQSQRPRSRP